MYRKSFGDLKAGFRFILSFLLILFIFFVILFLFLSQDMFKHYVIFAMIVVKR